MGFFSKIWKGVKNVVNKVTKAVKNVVKSVGKTAKKVWDKVKDVGVKVWDGVKNVTKKVSKTISKLGPFANIAMNFIPGFGQLWAAYGIWGQVAKGAITGYLTSGGDIKGALLGAAGGGLGHAWNNMPGKTISEKVGGWFDRWTNDSAIGKAIGQTATKFKDAFKPAGTQPVGQSIFDKHMATEYATTNTIPLDGAVLEKQHKLFQDEGLLGDKGLDLGQPGGPKLLPNVYNAPISSSLLDKAGDWADKLRKGTQAFAERDPEVSPTYNWNIGHTGPLQSVAANTIDAGDVNKQVGYGRDVDEQLIRSLGLKTLFEQYQASV